MKSLKKITVLIAEDHEMVRQGFHRLLELEEDMQVVGEAATGREAVALFKKLKPDVVLMDTAMPLLNGLEATRQILATAPDAKVVMLSAHADDAYLEGSVAAGGKGFVLKQTSSDIVVEALRAVHAGKTYFCSRTSKRMKGRAIHGGPAAGSRKARHATLTSRESEVLQLIAEGKANKEIAHELGIVIKTVEKHRANLMSKLDIHDIASLTRYAISAGVIESSVQVTTKEVYRAPASENTERVTRAELRTAEAEARTEHAETRTEMAETRTEQAETRAEKAETRTEQAETRTELAETRTEKAETRTEAAETALQRLIEKDFAIAKSPLIATPNVSMKGELDRCTERQRAILKLIAEGKNTKSIAAALELSPKTVEYHRMKLMVALKIQDIAGLVKFAVSVGG
ncbi:MAG: LuxR C-terminal-related transcriptional regulator [Limisphaerales bacterium]